MPLVPPRVRPGDTVAVVAPSFPAPACWPHRVERGAAYLASLGLEVRLMPNATAQTGWTAGPPQARADDLHAAFADDAVTVVLSAIGGNHANQLLPHLDWELIGAHPKVFQGFSDTTVLHWAIARHAGLRTFYGPALVTGLAEYPEVLPFTDQSLQAAWFSGRPLQFRPAGAWTDEFLDWDAKADLERPRQLRPSAGWRALRGGRAEGPLLGGCLETICWHLKGSASWLDLRGAVLLLETSEEAPSPAHVDAYLTDLEQLGVFDDAAGLVVARPAGYPADQVEQLWEVVAGRTEEAGLPVLAGVDAGHTDPMLTLPLGATVQLDPAAAVFHTTEPATR